MATAFPVCRTARQAKRAGPKLEAGPEASAERSEGTMEARRGETPQAARCATRTTARPAISQVAGDAQVSARNAQQSHAEPTPKGLRISDYRCRLIEPAEPP